MEDKQYTDIWEKYEKSRNYILSRGLASDTERNWRFFLGDQWHGVKSGGEELPVLNFIKPVAKYKIATVAQHSMVVNYTDMENREESVRVCELLNKKFSQSWEKGKMDSLSWKLIKESCIQGEAYLFFGTSNTAKPQKISNVDILFADEQQEELQEQPYIMIRERLYVDAVKEEARKNGIEEEEVAKIVSDEETENNLMEKEEVKGTEKCTSVLYMTKKDGVVHIARSVKECVYQPLTPIVVKDAEGNVVNALKLYPLVNLIWEDKPKSARGVSEIKTMIPNQLVVNKTYARRDIIVKMCAYPKLAYNSRMIENPNDLDKVGAKIRINGEASDVSKAIYYLNPTSMSGDAKNLSDDIKNNTKDLAGAGDAAMGLVNPEQASGAAIGAVRDQAALPLNDQVASYKQFVEDIASLWVNIWTVYNPNGFEVTYEKDGERITERVTAEEVESIEVDTRIDVSNDNPWTKYAEQQELLNLFTAGHINLEEYVEASSDNSPLPKNKLKRILEKRAQAMAEMPIQGQNVVNGGNVPTEEINEPIAEGGVPYEM